jgi:hypothetical protein
VARAFAAASSQYLSNASAVLSGVPLTMACWFKANDVSSPRCLMILTKGSGGSPNGYFMLWLRGDVGGDPVQFRVGTDIVYDATTTTSYTSGDWHHACGVASSATARQVYLNGGGKDANPPTNSLTPSGINTTVIGAYWNSSGTKLYYTDGLIAEAGIWNTALTDDEVASLAKGFCPLLVRPQNLKAYWPLIGAYSPELDVVGALNLSLSTSEPTKAEDHPRIIYPTRPKVIPAPTVAPWHYYNMMGRGQAV